MGKNEKVLQNKDIVIIVMGPTGAGKSTFINSVLQREFMTVGKTQDSCTSEIQSASISPIPGFPDLKDRRIIIVDTPGFDDTYKSDREILEKIAKWLEGFYKDGRAILGGVIYVHDLSNDRFGGGVRRNLEVFRKMCGNKALGKVVITTTKGRKLSMLKHPNNSSLAHERRRELTDGHWRDLVKNGASVRDFRDTHDSAWAIVDSILSRLRLTNLIDIYMQIQKELVDEGKGIPETEAGKELRNTLKDALKMQGQLETASAADGNEAALQEAENTIERLLSQIHELKIPFSLKMKRLFGFRNR
ncbi:hypothetical protein GALMADRAFT_249717 [Galerina marginata CBS 339.88]|uniref:AIG1-type G domain-containing protein n=1 Tax=Galerina marginata (strain CBS 339.88) TaxID=685588 RepID=A0A067SVA4_GALM3|nr:hypothetical protein GALMADRAFT_249717 [Galerina marginata CBS 339.88]